MIVVLLLLLRGECARARQTLTGQLLGQQRLLLLLLLPQAGQHERLKLGLGPLLLRLGLGPIQVTLLAGLRARWLRLWPLLHHVGAMAAMMPLQEVLLLLLLRLRDSQLLRVDQLCERQLLLVSLERGQTLLVQLLVLKELLTKICQSFV